MDLEITILLERVEALHGAAHWDEVTDRRVGRSTIEAAVATGLLEQPAPRFVVLPGTDPRTVTARHVRGALTCSSAAQILGYPMWSPVATTHIAVATNHALRPSRNRHLTGVTVHRPPQMTALTIDDFPCVTPAEVVACALRCLDELDAVCVADSALNRGDVTKEDVLEHLTGRRSASARRRLDMADPRARSPWETRVRLCLRAAGLAVDTGVVLQEQGERDLVVEDWLVIETDGYEYHSSRSQFAEDRRRDQVALAHGYVPLRLTYEDVAAGEAHILRIVGGALKGVAHSSRLKLPENRVILRNLP